MDVPYNLNEFDANQFDALIIPGTGGPRDGADPTGSLPVWVRNKLDWVTRSYRSQNATIPVILLSAGTSHKPGPLGPDGRNVQEATAGAMYLEERGVRNILEENVSLDTVGNAYFLRTIHTDVRGWRRLLVIANQFHMERVRLVFDWVFGFGTEPYQLAYQYFPDRLAGDPEIICARAAHEKIRTKQMREQISNSGIQTLQDFHRWLFTHHDLYGPKKRIRMMVPQDPVVDPTCLNSY